MTAKDEPHGNLATTGTPARGLTGATLGFFIGFAAVSLFGPTAKSLKGILGLSPLEVGFLVAAPSLSGSLLRIPFSAWVDTTGGKKPFLVLLLLSILRMARGVAVEAARSASALRGQEIFPAGTLVDSLVLSARNRKTWALVAIYFTTFAGFIAMTARFPRYS